MTYPQQPSGSWNQGQDSPYGEQQGSWSYPTGQPQQPWGQSAGWQQQQPGWGQQQPPGWGYADAWGYAPAPAQRRPGTVLAATIMTYVGSGLLGVLGLLMLLGAAVSDNFVRGAADGMGAAPGTPLGDVAGRLVAFALVLLVLSAALVSLSVFAQRGRGWARIALTVIGGIVMLFQLLAIVSGAGATILGFIYVAVAVTLLWVGAANAWYRSVKQAH